MKPKELTTMQREILEELLNGPKGWLWLCSRMATKRRMLEDGLVSQNRNTGTGQYLITDKGREALGQTAQKS